jgi:DNA mismatch repair protein MutL
MAVVRELAENAIDSGANRIMIDLCTDNLTVQVTDNGIGIDQTDLLRVALPHTTSKIANQQDLYQIKSLGFRGEALHCLAQLGRLTIISRKAGQTAFKAEYDHQGKCIEIPQQTAFAEGTTVKVSNLFADYPQRLAMLPTIPQQIRQTQKQIYNLAIANPQITWQVFLDRKEWIKICADQRTSQVAMQIISGIDNGDLLEYNSPDLQVVIGAPDRYHRPRADWIKVIINQRVVNNIDLEQTILSCFQRTLPRHRYPFCIAHLTIPPQQIDWNRHPAKSEVYIENLKHWQEYIANTIHNLLHSPQTKSSTASLFKVAEDQISYGFNNHIRAIAHVLKTYILAEGQQGIYLIEQHTAHERVLYENLEQQWQIVMLAEPIVLTNLQEYQVVHLSKIGIEIGEFGSNTWLVRSLPKLLVDHPEKVGILQEISQQKDLTSSMAQLACRTAIKNGTDLDLPAMHTLIQQWQATRHPHTCPHGRPICLRLESTDLARIFRRNWLVGT